CDAPTRITDDSQPRRVNRALFTAGGNRGLQRGEESLFNATRSLQRRVNERIKHVEGGKHVAAGDRVLTKRIAEGAERAAAREDGGLAVCVEHEQLTVIDGVCVGLFHYGVEGLLRGEPLAQALD